MATAFAVAAEYAIWLQNGGSYRNVESFLLDSGNAFWDLRASADLQLGGVIGSNLAI